VAAHLVATGLLLDEEPELALAHALAAKAIAARIGPVREAVGLAAYRAGRYDVAAAELRAARRITGDQQHLPLLADCERGLGRPERALELGRDPAAATLDRATQVELAIVRSGARRDMGQPEAAVLELQGADLDDDTVRPWSARLWYAYAAALRDAGRREEAARWFEAVLSVDEDDATDAAEQLAAL
jgi:tetratricopeptide (TPR) repeat protein